MKFEHTKVYNFSGAFRGLRNPKDSWHLSDSYTNEEGKFIIGPKDMNLAQRMISGGSCECKFLRQIMVCVDITANLAWWKEFDTYKVGTVANSCSTMHKLDAYPITLNNFEIDNYNPMIDDFDVTTTIEGHLIPMLEELRKRYKETKDKRYWYEIVRWLPEGWLQKRTITMTYENIRAMMSPTQRRNHKLNWWSGKDNPMLENFVAWARSLPYAQELLFFDEIQKKEEVDLRTMSYMLGWFIGHLETVPSDCTTYTLSFNLNKEEDMKIMDKTLDKLINIGYILDYKLEKNDGPSLSYNIKLELPIAAS